MVGLEQGKNEKFAWNERHILFRMAMLCFLNLVLSSLF